MNFIIQRDAETTEIIGVWHSQKQCAEKMGVKPPAIAQAIKLNGKCKGFLFEKADISDETILNAVKNELKQ